MKSAETSQGWWLNLYFFSIPKELRTLKAVTLLYKVLLSLVVAMYSSLYVELQGMFTYFYVYFVHAEMLESIT